MAKVPREGYDPTAGIVGRYPTQKLPCIIATTIVDEDQLEFFSQLIERRGDSPMRLSDHWSLIEARYDDGE
jgi:hypothetical protein